MQKNNKILTIILGTILLVSMFVEGTSASPMASETEESTSQPFSAQVPIGAAGVSCTTCHGTNTSLEGWNGLYSQILTSHTSSKINNSSIDLNLSQEAIFTILNQQHTEQSIRLESYSDPIVQCGFCHTDEAEHAYLLNSE